jgi:hypothetical protein
MLVTQPTPGTLPLTLARLTGEFLDLANRVRPAQSPP